MDAHIFLIEDESHELPTEGPVGMPIVTRHLQCMTCNQWAFLVQASGIDDGTWVKFQEDVSPAGSHEGTVS
jgi:hypothetical protein